MKFRKKPVEIEAMRFTGEPNGWPEVLDFLKGIAFRPDAACGDSINASIQIPTPEGTMTARAGDWIIRGVKGEMYPCKAEIFHATYEKECPRCLDAPSPAFQRECPLCNGRGWIDVDECGDPACTGETPFEP